MELLPIIFKCSFENRCFKDSRHQAKVGGFSPTEAIAHFYKHCGRRRDSVFYKNRLPGMLDIRLTSGILPVEGFRQMQSKAIYFYLAIDVREIALF